MGQQKYEIEIQKAIRAAASDGWSFLELPMVSLRSPVRGRRFSARTAIDGSYRVSRAAGTLAYRTRRLVHRFDLRLPCASREIVTIHDLPSARFSDEGKVPRSARESAHRALAVICPSQFAADELRELLGIEGLHVIPYGVSSAFHDVKPATLAERTQLGVTTPYVLHAAGASSRKNLPGLASAWRHVAEAVSDVELVLCGPPDPRRSTAFEGLPRVRLLGYQRPEVVARLTAASAAVVIPSLYEGFGLPALEGMACGIPVVASRRGALPEVCGDAALLVEPDAEGIASGLVRVLTDTALSTRLALEGPGQASGFSWETAARDHLSVYEQVIERS